MNNASIVTSQTSSTSSSEWQKNSEILLFEFHADQWIFDDIYTLIEIEIVISIFTSQTSSTSSSEWQKNSDILLFEFHADHWIFDDIYTLIEIFCRIPSS